MPCIFPTPPWLLPFSSLPVPFTLFHPLPGFHAVLLIQHSHPSLCTDCGRLLCTLTVSQPTLTRHCTTPYRRKGVSRVWCGASVPSFGHNSCEVSRTLSPSPNFPQLPISLCTMYRMVGSSLPFRKLVESKSAGMTQQGGGACDVYSGRSSSPAGRITRAARED